MGESQEPADFFDAETRAVPDDQENNQASAPAGSASPGQSYIDFSPPASPGDSQVSDDALKSPTVQLPPDGSWRTRASSDQRNQALYVTISVIVLLAIIAGGLYYLTGHHGRGTSTQTIVNTPQGIVNAYLLDYTGAKYMAMYQLVSAASIQRFNDPSILRGNYKNAEDYITSRTPSLLQEAQITSLSASPGAYTQQTATSGTIPVRVVLTSSVVGDIIQNITIPVRQEHGKWKVDWSPGLIFSQLDDPADPNYTRKVHLFEQNGMRGTIFDSEGDAIAKDEIVYYVGAVPGQITNQTQVVNTLSANLGVSADYVQSKLQGAPADDFITIRTLTSDQYNAVKSALSGVAGIQVNPSDGVIYPYGRVYPYGTITAPVTGYVSQVTADDIKNDKDHYYQSGDVIGRAGVEQWGETYLRPIKGGTLGIYPVNADGSLGQAVYTIASRAPVNGADIHTTINLKTQQATQTELASLGFSGGSVSVDPTTGAVLAMDSYPIYDPNDISLGNPNLDQILGKLDHPFLNRAYGNGSSQPIGSTFKPVTLAAALQNGITKDTTFTCTGSYEVPGSGVVRLDDKVGGHGTLTPARAIAPSCDVIFWQVAVKLNSINPDLLPNMARSFGYGSPTGTIGVPADAEDPGYVPTPDSNWTASNAADLGIGQGTFLATPLQITMFMAAVADNGVRMQPRLVSSVMASGGSTLVSFPAKQIGTVALSADNMQVVQMALLGPAYDPDGTAYNGFSTEPYNFPFMVACKTGTAQTSTPNPDSLFISYAPAPTLSGHIETPQIATGTLLYFAAGKSGRYSLPVNASAIASLNIVA